jgi:hypothetical protein
MSNQSPFLTYKKTEELSNARQLGVEKGLELVSDDVNQTLTVRIASRLKSLFNLKDRGFLILNKDTNSLEAKSLTSDETLLINNPDGTTGPTSFSHVPNTTNQLMNVEVGSVPIVTAPQLNFSEGGGILLDVSRDTRNPNQANIKISLKIQSKDDDFIRSAGVTSQTLDVEGSPVTGAGVIGVNFKKQTGFVAGEYTPSTITIDNGFITNISNNLFALSAGDNIVCTPNPIFNEGKISLSPSPKRKITTVTSSPYITKQEDSFLSVNTAVASTSMFLEDSLPLGQNYTIADASGNAAKNNITISRPWDPNDSFVAETSYDSIDSGLLKVGQIAVSSAGYVFTPFENKMFSLDTGLNKISGQALPSLILGNAFSPYPYFDAIGSDSTLICPCSALSTSDRNPLYYIPIQNDGNLLTPIKRLSDSYTNQNKGNLSVCLNDSKGKTTNTIQIGVSSAVSFTEGFMHYGFDFNDKLIGAGSPMSINPLKSVQGIACVYGATYPYFFASDTKGAQVGLFFENPANVINFIKSIPLPGIPNAIVYDNNKNYLYVAENSGGVSVWEFNKTTLDITKKGLYWTDRIFSSIVVSADGNVFYGASDLTRKIVAFSLNGKKLFVINRDNEVMNIVKTGEKTWGQY